MPLSDNEKQLLEEWASHPAVPVARKWLIEKRKAEEAALGASVLKDPSSFDPIAVARKAGDYEDGLMMLNSLLEIKRGADRRQQKEQ